MCYSISVEQHRSLTAHQPGLMGGCITAFCLSLCPPQHVQALPQYRLHHLHYYAKTVEEYIAKSEQSQPPFFRLMRDMYDAAATTCDNRRIYFDAAYMDAVRRLTRGLAEAQGGLPDGGQLLGPLPEYRPHSRDDYALYLFLKVSGTD